MKQVDSIELFATESACGSYIVSLEEVDLFNVYAASGNDKPDYHALMHINKDIITVVFTHDQFPGDHGITSADTGLVIFLRKARGRSPGKRLLAAGVRSRLTGRTAWVPEKHRFPFLSYVGACTGLLIGVAAAGVGLDFQHVPEFASALGLCVTLMYTGRFAYTTSQHANMIDYCLEQAGAKEALSDLPLDPLKQYNPIEDEKLARS